MNTWLDRSGFAHRSNGKTRITHVSLTGGKYTIPESARASFHTTLASFIAKGQAPALAEMIPEGEFRLYADIDGINSVDTDLMLKVAISAQTAIAETWACEPEDVIVATKPDGSPGMHLHIPNIVTTAAHARLFAEALAQKLNTEECHVDTGVYSNGLRMPGCTKRDKSPGYVPVATVTSDGEFMQHCPPTTVADWCLIIQHLSLHKEPDQQRTPTIHQGTSCELEAMPPHLTHVAVEPCIVTRVIQCMQDRDIREAAFSFVGKDETGSTIIIGLKTKRCLNLKPPRKFHSKNNVYLVVTPYEVYQKCHCKNGETHDRVSGPCNTFRSKSMPIPADLAEHMFPNFRSNMLCSRHTVDLRRLTSFLRNIQ